MDNPLPVAQSNFGQQGSVDWVSLCQGTVSFSIGILARLQNAGVDSYTVMVGQEIAKQFRLGPHGAKNVQQAVDRLTSHFSYQQVLEFGFGVMSIPRLLCKTEEGSTLLAMCAALSEIYNQQHVAEILREIVLCHGAPRALTPGLSSWRSLVKVCAGTFATTNFGLRAETLMSLHPEQKDPRTTDRRLPRDPGQRSVSSPQSLARALIELGKLSRGQVLSVQLQGGGDAAVIAALAEWLFDLRLSISYHPTASLLYTNCQSTRMVQLEIVFADHNSLASEPNNIEHTLIKRPQRTLPLENISVILKPDIGSLRFSEEYVYAVGRVPWERCLEITFGDAFERLRTVPRLCGRLIGCAARIFKAFAKAERSLTHEERQFGSITHACESWKWYSNRSYGRGYMDYAAERLPELAGFLSFASETLQYSLADAVECYENSISELANFCSQEEDCQICGQDEDHLSSNGICLVILMEKIIILCRTLGSLQLPRDLSPKRLGLRHLYGKHFEDRFDIITDPSHTMKWHEFAITKMTLKTLVAVSVERDILYDIISLFTGYSPVEKKLGPMTAAVSQAGLCVYLDFLRQPSLDRETVGQFNIIPGHIELEGVAYEEICDFPKLLSSNLEASQHTVSLSLVAGESDGRVLEAGYRLLTSAEIELDIRPWKATRHIQQARGKIKCDGINCREKVRFNSPAVFQSDFMGAKSLGDNIWHFQSHDQAICCAFFHTCPSGTLCLLRDTECLSCAIYTAEQEIDRLGVADVVIISWS